MALQADSDSHVQVRTIWDRVASEGAELVKDNEVPQTGSDPLISQAHQGVMAENLAQVEYGVAAASLTFTSRPLTGFSRRDELPNWTLIDPPSGEEEE